MDTLLLTVGLPGLMLLAIVQYACKPEWAFLVLLPPLLVGGCVFGWLIARRLNAHKN